MKTNKSEDVGFAPSKRKGMFSHLNESLINCSLFNSLTTDRRLNVQLTTGICIPGPLAIQTLIHVCGKGRAA